MIESSPSSPSSGDALSRLGHSIKQHRGLPPVDRWNPPHCGEIGMRIAADGTWFYQGTPIGRAALVRLFSTILRKDPEGHVLVTPVERVAITVDDAPFLAVEMAVEGEGAARRIAFRTNVDDLVHVGADHPLRFARDEHAGVKPYVLVRGGLWALVTRALTFDLVALAEERVVDGEPVLGVAAADQFFVIGDASEASGDRSGDHGSR